MIQTKEVNLGLARKIADRGGGGGLVVDDISARLAEVQHYREGRDEERKDVVSFLRREAKMATDGELLRLAADLTRAQFIEEMTLAIERSKTKAVLGYRTLEDAGSGVGDDDDDRSVVFVMETMGILAIDDMDAPVSREGGKTSSPLYELDLPHRWPKGLFEKLVGLIWVIDRPINPLDSIAKAV